jgi:hypothetical protein
MIRVVTPSGSESAVSCLINISHLCNFPGFLDRIVLNDAHGINPEIAYTQMASDKNCIPNHPR